MGTQPGRFYPLKGTSMTKQEIDNMMRDLPSQRVYYEQQRRRYILDEALAGVAFVALVVILCFM